MDMSKFVEGDLYTGLQGPRRLAAELKALVMSVKAGHLPGVTEVSLLQDDLSVWRIKVSRFDSTTPAGQALNVDLYKLEGQHGLGFVELEARFPADYPSQPFFLRVVRPRMQHYTGHVTVGGAICLEALTNSRGPGAWRPDFCVEGVLAMVLHNMLHSEAVDVRTISGIQRAGPLQIAMGPGVHKEYSLAEAQSSFQRIASQHGWHSKAAAAPVLKPSSSAAPSAARSTAPGPAAAAASSSSAAQLPAPAHWTGNGSRRVQFVQLPLPGSGAPRSPELAEAEHVLSLFQRQGRAAPSDYEVVRIERVENLELWRRYQRCVATCKQPGFL
ncbi:hypothetical protein ABPG75_000157 [Micractinium tetrahymenae]